MPSGIVCKRIDDVDRLQVEGVLNEETAFYLAKLIEDLRQKGACSILWVGTGLKRVEPHASHCLLRPISVFRRFGGRIAAADFQPEALRGLEQTRWRKHLNLFGCEEEALRFLRKPALEEPIEPVIDPMTDPIVDPMAEAASQKRSYTMDDVDDEWITRVKPREKPVQKRHRNDDDAIDH